MGAKLMRVDDSEESPKSWDLPLRLASPLGSLDGRSNVFVSR